MPIPTHLVDEWPVWRIVHAGMLTVAEAAAMNTISLREIDDANDVLDLFEAARAQDTK